MKKFYVLLIALLMVSGARAQWGSSCLPEGITFATQAQIDSFQVYYPSCIVIEGNVTISGSDITNLNGLSVLTSIGDSLVIYANNALTSLTGLEGITSFGGSLEIDNNTSLTSLTGLEGLNSIGGDLQIGYYLGYGNPALTSLTGHQRSGIIITPDYGTRNGG